MNLKLRSAIAAAGVLLASQAMASITFYEGEGYRGRAFTTNERIGNFERRGMNDRVGSVVIDRGRWEVCDEPRFQGRCVVLRRGSYDSLRPMGLDRTIASARPTDDRRRYENEIAAPADTPDYAFRRRPSERVFEAPVTSVQAVVGPPNQRCWVERQQVGQAGGQANVGGAIVGGLIGGILGHQVGKGSGRDAATGVGAVAGAAIGANTGGGSTGGPVYGDVQRCQTVPNTAPAYYDVSYVFRGTPHRIQMSAPPGPSISVNANGEPRQ